MLLFRIFGDIFSRHDIGGGTKTLWLIFVLLVPFPGVFGCVSAKSDGMPERTMQRAQSQQKQMDNYVRTTAASGSPTAQIGEAKQLLDSGAITQTEFDAIKQKALA